MGLQSVLNYDDVDENLYLAARKPQKCADRRAALCGSTVVIHYKKVIVTKPAISKIEAMWG